MSYKSLLKIDKPLFTHYDVAHAVNIKLSSAAVSCSRYVSEGLLTRLKRGLYARTEVLKQLNQLDLFRAANILQVPSYISLMSALSYYGIAAGAQGGLLESISMKRTKAYEVGDLLFRYRKIVPYLYNGFEKREGAFIALPEKAVLDTLYLASMGRYPVDLSSLDLTKIDEKRLVELALPYPLQARNYVEHLICKKR